jgi:hypothetical protein
MQSEAIRIQATIADVASTNADAARIAEVAAETWREIFAALSPVIGPGGAAALYQRSLILTRAAYPCLASVREGTVQPGEFSALRQVLSQQSTAQAAAANGALLHTFCDLLTSLIGVSLTERLLHSIHNLPSGDPAEQSTPT